uniref:RING-type domain-containing protein n=1 Tax=Steinernema glaseri TaxID=37863 RepID=A0A1I7YM35_9BILA
MSTFGRFDCAICFGWLEDSQDIAITECGHVFHKACISTCLETGSGCPSCRQEVKELKRVFFSARPFDEKTEITELKEQLEQAYSAVNALRIKNEELESCLEESEEYNWILRRQLANDRNDSQDQEADNVQSEYWDDDIHEPEETQEATAFDVSEANVDMFDDAEYFQLPFAVLPDFDRDDFDTERRYFEERADEHESGEDYESENYDTEDEDYMICHLN